MIHFKRCNTMGLPKLKKYSYLGPYLRIFFWSQKFLGPHPTVILSFLYRSRSTFWKSNFSKSIRQNFKVNVYSVREIYTLLENVFTIKFCRMDFEKFDLQKVERERYKIERITVFFFKVQPS